MKQIKGWYLPANDTHFEPYITDEGYQEVHRKAILNFVKENRGELGNALDIGAHVGFWLKDMCKEFQQVYAFEPIKEVRDCIKHNVKAENYKVLPYGLSNQEGKLKVVWNQNETGNTYISENGDTEIEVKRLDDMMDVLPKVDYIKIDAEGHELNVCRGGLNYIKKHKPFVHVEVKDKVMKRHGLGLPDVIDFFNDMLDYRRKFAIKSEMVFGPNE